MKTMNAARRLRRMKSWVIGMVEVWGLDRTAWGLQDAERQQQTHAAFNPFGGGETSQPPEPD